MRNALVYYAHVFCNFSKNYLIDMLNRLVMINYGRFIVLCMCMLFDH